VCHRVYHMLFLGHTAKHPFTECAKQYKRQRKVTGKGCVCRVLCCMLCSRQGYVPHMANGGTRQIYDMFAECFDGNLAKRNDCRVFYLFCHVPHVMHMTNYLKKIYSPLLTFSTIHILYMVFHIKFWFFLSFCYIYFFYFIKHICSGSVKFEL